VSIPSTSDRASMRRSVASDVGEGMKLMTTSDHGFHTIPHIHSSMSLLSSAQLDELRETYADLDALLLEVSQEDIAGLHSVFSREVLEQYLLIYLPQIGFLCRLPTHDETTPAQQLNGFEFKFKTDTHVFYKNATASSLDEQFGDMQGNITDMENVIARRVQEQIIASADVIRELSSKVAELDW
jgi:DNA mismatch repair ATPase MutS